MLQKVKEKILGCVCCRLSASDENCKQLVNYGLVIVSEKRLLQKYRQKVISVSRLASPFLEQFVNACAAGGSI